MIGYPYPVDARIVAVHDSEGTLRLSRKNNVVAGTLEWSWTEKVEDVKEQYLRQRAIDVGEIELLLECAPVIGMHSTLNGGRRRRYAETTALVPVQAIPAFKPRPDPRCENGWKEGNWS